MDIMCLQCGEPVEVDYLAEVAEANDVPVSYVQEQFRENGCIAIGSTCSEEWVGGTGGNVPKEAASALTDLLGDDIDGLAVALEDAEAFFS